MQPSRPVATHGLTHVALAVSDVGRAFRFYEAVFGMVAVHRDAAFVQAQTPGSRDVLVFERNPDRTGNAGGVVHFGFRLTRPEDIDLAAEAIAAAGGTVTDKGEFIPGEPYVFFRDPDGNTVEVWFELPTPVDPLVDRPDDNRDHRRGGTIGWNELNTRDPDAAMAFFSTTLGWTFETMEMPGYAYRFAWAGGRRVAGIFPLTAPEFTGVGSHWLPYISVDDVDARAAGVAAAGGEVMRAPWDVPGVGRMAIVKDPTGAVAAWITAIEPPG
jgi:predicted enzyme related to lactoylglutathione lyase